MDNIIINGRTLGRGHKPFIVGEAGINHNGEIDKAFEMIRIAKIMGIDAIKFQTFKAKEVVADSKLMYTYKSQGKEITESQYEMFRRCEFSREEWFKIKRKCDEENIPFLSTPQNISDLDLLLELGVPAIKVGSDDLINFPLLRSYSTTKLPMIISSGMSNLAEIYEALDTIGAFDGYPTILLHAISQYPTPPEDVNLEKLKTLSCAFPNIPLGFSDHTQGSLASSLAVAYGAIFFEKHFTLDHNLSGPDHWFSVDPQGLKQWSDSIKEAYKMLGSKLVRPTKNELIVKKEAQRRIVAIKTIKYGESYTTENIAMRRVLEGVGLLPSLYSLLLGKTANRNYNPGQPIEI